MDPGTILDLEIEPGEVFGFLEPNGAGKSTTMRVLLDLIKPTSGRRRCSDWTPERTASRSVVGLVSFPAFSRSTQSWSLRKVLYYLAELPGGVDRRVGDGLAERFHADLDRPISELSTGNRQKLGLIQVRMHDPELLILDEPIAGLDPLGLPV